MRCPNIAVTIGDPNGIGPEVVLKSLGGGRDDFQPVLVGPRDVWEYHREKLQVSGVSISEGGDIDHTEPRAPVVVDTSAGEGFEVAFGEIRREAGALAMRAVERAVDMCLSGAVDGMVTAPISKEAVRRAGYEIPGHTEFIAARTGTDSFAMMMAADDLRVALVTTHCPVSAVAERITRSAVDEKLRVLETTLRRDFGAERPSIAVLGLNPHAGDGGMIGREEIDIIEPLLAERTSPDAVVRGPFSADAFFGRRRYLEYDAVLAMYHDQGLVPFKTLHSNEGINFTAGLPIVRTSPDHGTAFDIAGEGKALPGSMNRAIDLAVEIARRRAS